MTDAIQDDTQPVFNMDKIYVKDLSLEIPHAPHIFLERENPQIEVQLHTAASTIDESVFEVSVTATVTAKVEEKVMFLIEATQAGIFTMRNLPQIEMDPVLAVMCPNILFPYLREVVSSIAVRAGFAPVMLNPINFEVLYHQQQQQQKPETTH
jgi:preprotein translocase subunit SecB